MKKIIITTLAAVALAHGAFAQGSVTAVQSMFSADGVTTGIGQQDPATASAYYTGNITLEVFYASTASVTQTQINAINALDGTANGGASALALLNSDGFSLVSDINPASDTTQTPGALTYAVNDGGFTAADANNINLMSPTVTGSTAWMALYAVGAGGSAVLAYSQAMGNDPFVSPSLPAANMATDPEGLNLDLTTTAVPEPGTMALSALGGLSLFFFRRKN